MSNGWDPPWRHKNNFFQFLKTPLDSISGALSKVLKPFFSNLPLDRTFYQTTRLLRRRTVYHERKEKENHSFLFFIPSS